MSAALHTADVIQLHNNDGASMPTDKTRMSDRLKWAWSQKTGSASYKLVLAVLTEHANKDLKSFPSLTTLEAETELNERTVRKALLALQEMGLIKDTGERTGFTKQVPVYELCLDVMVNNPPTKVGNLPKTKASKDCNSTVVNDVNNTAVQRAVILSERAVILQSKGCKNVSKGLQYYSTEPLEPPKNPHKNPQGAENPLLPAAQPAPKTRAGKSTDAQALNRQIWAAYSQAYTERYRTEPVRNAKVNKQIALLADRIGKDAPAVAGWFVNHNNRYYIQRGHSVDLLLSDCEKLRTEWATGTQITAKAAQQLDNKQSNLSAFEQFKKLVAQKYGNGDNEDGAA